MNYFTELKNVGILLLLIQIIIISVVTFNF